MRVAVWYSEYGLPETFFEFPYKTRSPSVGKVLEYKTKREIYEEIDRLLQEKGTKKFGIGQSLFLQMPFFCNPISFIPYWCWEMIKDYQIVKEYNIPLASDLDSINVWQLDCFSVIKNEITNISIYQRTKDG